METIRGKKQSKMLIIGIAAVVLVVAVIVAGLTASGSRVYKNHLDMAQKYLEELDYEQAVVELRLAIEIEPKNSEAYFALADVYMAMEDYESALAVLEEGYAATGDEVFLTEKERIAGEYAELQEEQRREQEQQEERKKREQEEQVEELFEKYAGLADVTYTYGIGGFQDHPEERFLTFSEREEIFGETADRLEQYLVDLKEIEGLPEELYDKNFDYYNSVFTESGACICLAEIYLYMGKLEECLRMRTEYATLCDRPDLVRDGNDGLSEQTDPEYRSEYDKYGRITGSFGGGIDIAYVYEEAHNGATHITITEARGQTEIDITYDGEGRILHEHSVASYCNVTNDIDYSYTGNNSVVRNVISIGNGEAPWQETWFYNEYGIRTGGVHGSGY